VRERYAGRRLSVCKHYPEERITAMNPKTGRIKATLAINQRLLTRAARKRTYREGICVAYEPRP